MITAAERKTRQVERQVQGTDPDISMRRAVAIMADLRACSVKIRAVAEYDLIFKEEGTPLASLLLSRCAGFIGVPLQRT